MEKNRKEAVFAELGKYSIDISKLVFGGVNQNREKRIIIT